MGSLEENIEKRKARVTAKVTETETLSLDEEALSEIVEEEMMESGDIELTLDGNLSVSSPVAVQGESPIDTIKGIGDDVKTIADNLGEISEGLKDLGVGSDFSKTAEELKKAAGSLPDKIGEGEKLFNEAKDAAKPLIDEGKKAFNEAKEAAKPVIDEAKKAANEMKEQGKKVAAKAGGAAITAATGGVIPPKLGEWASKKALNRAEKKIKKKAGKAKNKLAAKTAAKKEELKEKAKNNKALNKAKEKTGKAVDTTIKAIKAIKFYKAIKKWAPIVLVAIGLITIICFIITIVQLFLPGAFGDVNEEIYRNNYSARDQKIIKQLDEINEKYSNADGSVVMSTISYPHYEIIQSSEIMKITGKFEEDDGSSMYDQIDLIFEDDSNLTFEEKVEKYSYLVEAFGENIFELVFDELKKKAYEVIGWEYTEDEEFEKAENDMYLNLYYRKKYRDEYDKLMKIYNEKGKEEFELYLKNEYFLENSDYKKLLEDVDADDLEYIKEKLIIDINENAELFERYITDMQVCHTSLISVGKVEPSELLKAGADNIYIDVKEESCTTSSGIGSCGSWYASPISLGEYIKGVVWTEISINESTDKEQIKAQMVAAKSYVLGRYKTMGWSLSKTATGAYVIPIRANTTDQDYCNYKEGCINKLSGNRHGAAGEAEQAILEEAWQAVKNTYIVDKSTNNTAGSYCADRNKTAAYDCSWCKLGTCLSQTELKTYKSTSFETILMKQYSSYGIVTMEGESASMKVAGADVCTNNTANMAALRNKVVSFALSYADQIYYYEGAVADSKVFEENNFGTEIEPDIDGRTKKGLGNVGFVNWVFWNAADINFGNTNDIEKILSEGYEITQDKLLTGDIGYSEDKSVIGIYAGENKWILADSVEGRVVAKPDDRLTKFLRLNIFKLETYNYTIRTTKPTVSEWSGDNMLPTGSTNYLGECPWYARNRAYEIIRELKSNGSLTDDQFKKLYKRLNNTSGNGGDFYPGNSSADQGYPGSTNIDDVRAGAFMGMTSGSVYGHVAIIEYANPDEDKIIVTDGWADGNYCTFSNYSCIRFNYKEYTYASFKNAFQGRFKGFLYFLEE